MPRRFRVIRADGSVSMARRQVLSAVRGWGLRLSSDRLDDLRLLTSELVTNVIEHTHATCAVGVQWTGTRVRVEVTDPDPALPQVVEPTAENESGRGLTLVAALSAEWGVSSNPPGKTVWCELSPVQGEGGAGQSADHLPQYVRPRAPGLIPPRP